MMFHFINMLMLIFLPVGVVFWFKLGPGNHKNNLKFNFSFFPPLAAAFIVMFNYAIVWMKMISYTQVNSWCRCGQGGKALPTADYKSDQSLVRYPDNLTVKGKPL